MGVEGFLRRARLPEGGAAWTNQFVLALLGLQRLSYLVPQLLGTGTGYRSSWWNAVLVAVTLGWNVYVFWWRRRDPSTAVVWVDVAWAVVVAWVVTVNCPVADPFGPANWASRNSQAAAALAGAVFLRVASAVVATVLLMAAHIALTEYFRTPAGPSDADLVVFLNALLWFAVISGVCVRYLRRQARRIDEAAADRVATGSRLAAERAGSAARAAHHRELHDTVLATLTAIARGGLDHRAVQVRERCARDADYIRYLLLAESSSDAADLAVELRAVRAAAGGLGLRIRYRQDALPEVLPAPVVTGVSAATREALNNVAAHAGVDVAWLTVTWQDGALVVRVVDRGAGFDPAAAGAAGLGLRDSIRGRMAAVGGAAHVTSAPGEGTCVELRWPR